jgi:hypothetical protein
MLHNSALQILVKTGIAAWLRLWAASTLRVMMAAWAMVALPHGVFSRGPFALVKAVP